METLRSVLLNAMLTHWPLLSTRQGTLAVKLVNAVIDQFLFLYPVVPLQCLNM